MRTRTGANQRGRRARVASQNETTADDRGPVASSWGAWTAPELARFFGWADEHDSDVAMGWRLLTFTGMQRGEALALR